MEVPPILKSNVQNGNVVLLLGAGASLGARHPNGKKAPSSEQLAALIADRFLGAGFSHYPLNQIADLAINEADLTTVQEFIRETFEPFEPTEAHGLLCKFRWHGLATTNFDRLVEKAYAKCSDRVQNVVTFIDDSDRVDDKMRDLKAVQLLKLHGCITRTANPDAPLILTPDQYIQHRFGRQRVFGIFKEWCYEHIVVFIGSSGQDSDLRQILLELDREIQSRPKFFMVAPDMPEQVERLWVKKRVDVIRATFDQFMAAMDVALPSPFRGVAVLAPSEDLPISTRFTKKNITLSEPTKRALALDVEYVKGAKVEGDVSAQDFYRGADLGWAPIAFDLDVKRGLVDSILIDHFVDKSRTKDGLQFVVIKAHAGAGKKTLLRRIAWDASQHYDCLCLYAKAYGCISSAALSELVDLVDERIFLFVEDAPDRIRELLSLVNNIGDGARSLTIVATARTNEWNVACQDLSEFVTSEYELGYLSKRDIGTLLGLLEKHNALGTLRTLAPDARVEALKERAGRQLLVALHEATLGRPFVQIIRDEYENIRPAEAQRMYLSICVLNRLDIPVRAGIISRMYGISFADFKDHFFRPLEHVVHARENPVIRDFEYVARHPHIADILVEEILAEPESRFEEYVKCLRYLNLAYDSDRRAFHSMIRANDLLRVFSDHSMVQSIYELAREVAGNDPEVLHQMAIYEMKRANGNMESARQMLEAAHEIAPRNHTIIHSMAELHLHMAEKTGITEIQLNKHIREAENICRDNARALDSHGRATLIKAQLLRLQGMLSKETAEDSDVDLVDAIKKTEEYLEDTLQSYPGESYLLDLEAKLGKLLSDSTRVMRALTKSFDLNPRNSLVALRLSRCHQEKGDKDKAKEILKCALDANNNRKELHYAYSKLLMSCPETPGEELEYHLQRAYSPGDRNFDAQLLHARQLYIDGSFDEAKKLFRAIGLARVPAKLKFQPRYPIDHTYSGEIRTVEASYCWIRRDGIQDRIYCHQETTEAQVWRNLVPGVRVTFTIAFNMRGPVATTVVLEGARFAEGLPTK